jgi:Peptidase M50B-like
MKRQHQIALIGSTLAFSWLAMQAVHEFGHVLGAMLSGGQVAEIVLHPARISQTRLARNPHPLLVAWMGPIVGVTVPAAAALVARIAKLNSWYLFQFFAGFCLVANGAYLAFGSLGRIGDAGDLLHHGARPLLLWLFGFATIAIGLWLWHGLGRYFGLGKGAGHVDTVAAYVMLVLAIIVVVIELVFARLLER